MMDIEKWKSKFEEMPPSDTMPIPSNVKVAKPNLKPLPSELKHTFLGEDGMFPMVISSHLDHVQEVNSLSKLGPIIEEICEMQLITSSTLLPSPVQPPKVELKPLPHEFTFARLNKEETFLVVHLDVEHGRNTNTIFAIRWVFDS